jgi:hypothetical protein
MTHTNKAMQDAIDIATKRLGNARRSLPANTSPERVTVWLNAWVVEELLRGATARPELPAATRDALAAAIHEAIRTTGPGIDCDRVADALLAAAASRS